MGHLGLLKGVSVVRDLVVGPDHPPVRKALRPSVSPGLGASRPSEGGGRYKARVGRGEG